MTGLSSVEGLVGVNSVCGVQSKRKRESHESCVCIAGFQHAGVTVDFDHGQWRVVAETLSVLWQTWAVYIRALIFFHFVSHVSMRNLIM